MLFAYWCETYYHEVPGTMESRVLRSIVPKIMHQTGVFSRRIMVKVGFRCQTYGLAQMEVLPDLPKFCLVLSLGPALNDNSVVIQNLRVIRL